jgi:hypothetical protein
MQNYIWWKWSLGTQYERSKRIKRSTDVQRSTDIQRSTEVKRDVDNHILKQCLLSDDECWQQEKQMAQKTFLQEEDTNVREDTYNRMSQREWTVQTGVNPYSNNNYMDDLIVQETFLKPINSQIDRLKSKEEEKINYTPSF